MCFLSYRILLLLSVCYDMLNTGSTPESWMMQEHLGVGFVTQTGLKQIELSRGGAGMWPRLSHKKKGSLVVTCGVLNSDEQGT